MRKELVCRMFFRHSRWVTGKRQNSTSRGGYARNQDIIGSPTTGQTPQSQAPMLPWTHEAAGGLPLGEGPFRLYTRVVSFTLTNGMQPGESALCFPGPFTGIKTRAAAFMAVIALNNAYAMRTTFS